MYTQRTSGLTKEQAAGQKKWYVIDGTDKIVGRLATEIADLLRGKKKAQFTPNIDTGDYVILTNCEKVRFTGNKLENKTYNWHTGYIGGLKTRTAKEQLERHPELIMMKAVERMLPKGALGRKQLKKFKVFKGENHDHEAQNPEAYTPKN